MVTNVGARMGHLFGAIADATRRDILDLLRRRDLSAGDLAGHFPVSRPAISRHLRILLQMSLVSSLRAREPARDRPDSAGVERFEQDRVRHQARHAPVAIRKG
jgi:DNA-binding transcriptional ArsR family regulator